MDIFAVGLFMSMYVCVSPPGAVELVHAHAFLSVWCEQRQVKQRMCLSPPHSSLLSHPHLEKKSQSGSKC